MIVPQNTRVGQYPRTQKIVPLYVSGIYKPVAFVNPQRRLLYKSVDGEKHFVKTPPGIAFDDDVLRRAGELGAVDIEVTDRTSPNHDVYRCTLDTFLRHAEELKRRHGRQLVLRFTYWSKNGARSEVERQAEAQAEKAAAADVVQMTLFGGGL